MLMYITLIISMTCLNMFNTEQRDFFTPRISFSNDFGDTQNALFNHQNHYKEAPVSSEFEFSVANNDTLITATNADEIFSKGVLLPFKGDGFTKMTLKDELLAHDDGDACEELPGVLKGFSGRWIAKMGLKRNHVKTKSCGGLERVVEEKTHVLDRDHNKKTQLQELLNCVEPIYRDLKTEKRKS